MPKPLFLRRPSGLYVRFLVPLDLRGQLGRRFLVRSLGRHRGDRARLVVAAQAMALSDAFERLRQGAHVADIDLKKLLRSVQQAADRGGTHDWTATNLRVAGADFGNVTTTGREDTKDFIETMRAAVRAAKDHVSVPESKPSSLLSEEIEHHIADLQRRKLSTDTITESKHSLRLLLAIAGDIPSATLTPAHVRQFWDAVRWWPANATVKPAYRNLTVAEIIARGRVEDVPSPSPHTLNKHRQRLGVFFTGLVGVDILARSPLRGMGPEIDTSTELETGRAFTPDELRNIFDPDRFTAWAKTPHRWWGPMLGLYTGARVNEVAQLYIDDVRRVHGTWGLFFWKNARNQKIKRKSSIRFVPLAQPLIDAGFLDFVEDMRATGHPRLFPHLPAGTAKNGKPNGMGYGRQLSRQFAAYLKTLGMEKGVAFHAFRHTLSTSLAEVDVETTTIARITGHAQKQQVPTLETHYIHIADTKTLPELVSALEVFRPSVSLPAYKRGRFCASTNDLSVLHQ